MGRPRGSRNRQGDPALTEEVFWSRIERGAPDECWLWTGGRRPKGYGVFWFEGRNRNAHVLAYIFTNGSLPEGKTMVCHRCDNPPCCNPAHLYAGTAKENAADVGEGMKAWARASGERHGSAKLSAGDVAAIRASSEPTRVLAERYGVSATHVRRIVRGLRWHERTI